MLNYDQNLNIYNQNSFRTNSIIILLFSIKYIQI